MTDIVDRLRNLNGVWAIVSIEKIRFEAAETITTLRAERDALGVALRGIVDRYISAMALEGYKNIESEPAVYAAQAALAGLPAPQHQMQKDDVSNAEPNGGVQTDTAQSGARYALPEPSDEQMEVAYRAHDWERVPHAFRGSVGFERGARWAWKQAEAKIADLTKANDQLFRLGQANYDDAERYRWLRAHSWLYVTRGESVLNFGAGYDQTAPGLLDRMVDAARTSFPSSENAATVQPDAAARTV